MNKTDEQAKRVKKYSRYLNVLARRNAALGSLREKVLDAWLSMTTAHANGKPLSEATVRRVVKTLRELSELGIADETDISAVIEDVTLFRNRPPTALSRTLLRNIMNSLRKEEDALSIKLCSNPKLTDEFVTEIDAFLASVGNAEKKY